MGFYTECIFSAKSMCHFFLTKALRKKYFKKGIKLTTTITTKWKVKQMQEEKIDEKQKEKAGNQTVYKFTLSLTHIQQGIHFGLFFMGWWIYTLLWEIHVTKWGDGSILICEKIMWQNGLHEKEMTLPHSPPRFTYGKMLRQDEDNLVLVESNHGLWILLN